MFQRAALLSFSLLAIRTLGQQVGTYTTETHPSLTFEHCTTSGGCTTLDGSVVLDSNWRWVHSTTSSTNCYTGNTWDTTLCPDDVTCAANCALDGADYSGTYGITSSGNSLRLNFVTDSSNVNIGSRVYLLAPGSTTEYQGFNLLNQEFAFTVNVANLPCGLNGALYMSEMDLDGGVSRFPTNKAGANYGTGYCDSQCPRDIKFIDGQANCDGWVADSNSVNSGTGNHGTCCTEMDIWEANSISAAYTAHPCSVDGQSMCETTACGGSTNRYGSVCDPDGCDFNSYRMGNTTFYGPGLTVDTTQPFTVITQFLTDSGTASGNLNQIKRIYVQNGKTIQNSYANVAGIPANTYNSLTEAYCDATKVAFNNTNSFDAQGGFGPMTKAFNHGMVLVLSLWDDYAVDMLWLDSDYPTTDSATAPGVARGTCPTTSGVPSVVESQDASSYVVYSDIRYGDIGSTWGTGSSSSGSSTSSSSSSSKSSSTTSSSSKSSSTTSSSSTHTSSSSTKTSSSSTKTSSTTSATGAGQTLYGQCGGETYTGPTTCAQGTCVYSNPWYSQCLNT